MFYIAGIYLLGLIIKHTVAVALKLRICNLVPEFPTDALVFRTLFREVGAVATGGTQTILNSFYHFRCRIAERAENLAAFPYVNGGLFAEENVIFSRFTQEIIGPLLSKASEDFNPMQVSISQLYGIEINDFAVTVARTALWIAESQMMKETEEIVRIHLDFLPLTSCANIVEANAAEKNREEIVSMDELNFIIGNPPFVGARLMEQPQKDDINHIFKGWKKNGNPDYVSCWDKKAADLMMGTCIRTAIVSTNSITQGEAVANLWKPPFDQGVHIDFAHRTFQWDSEAKIKALVQPAFVQISQPPCLKALAQASFR